MTIHLTTPRTVRISYFRQFSTCSIILQRSSVSLLALKNAPYSDGRIGNNNRTITVTSHADNNTRSPDVVTLARPSLASSLRVTDRSFQYASPHLWNQLPFSLREPVSPLYAYLNPSFSSPLSHPSPLHSFTLNSKLTFFVNLFPRRSLTIDTSD